MKSLTLLLALSGIALFLGAGCTSLSTLGTEYRHAVASQSFTVSVDGEQQRVQAGTEIVFRDPLAVPVALPVKGGK